MQSTMIVATSKIRIFWLALSLGVFTIPNFAGAARQGSAVPPIDFNAIIGSLDKDQCSLVLRDFFGRIEDTEILQDQAVETFFLELLKASERGSIQPRMVIKLVTSRLEKQEPSTKALSIIFRMLSLFSKQRLLSDLELLVFFDRFAHHEVPRVAAAGRGLNLALTFLDELLEKSESPHMIEVVFERYHAIA
ncbi:MAG TPA: hypothetical protein PLH57_05515, partial [Oligoflexia bacterium]|nr:hypothetical protein [Oligoflexia bacterium]